MKNNVSSKILLSDEMEDMLNDAEMKNLPDELFLQLGVDESESGIKFRRRLQDFLADNYDEVREAVEDGTGMSALKSNPIRKAYEQYLMEKMESEVDFMLPLNSLVVKSGMYDEIIGEMLDEGKIELFDRVYRVKMPHVSDWISQISSQNQRTAVMLRAEGNTLEECGSKMGNRSRQSVDQLIRSALRNKPALREDDYRYWFERYNMDREAFNTIFLKAETDCTYGYLVMVCGRRRGKKDVSEMFNDPLLTKRMYHGLRLYMTRDSVFIHGEDVPLRTSFIAECIARNEFADREGTIREFYNRYVQILKEKHIQDDKRLNKSLRAFEGIVDRMSWCLQKTGRIVRYCPITADEVREFVSAMNLDQYRNIEMSTEKIFRDNAEMMKEYDIRDGYELHSFLRKNEKIWNGDNRYDIYFSRMPNIRFGKSDRNRQVRDLMFRLAPVSLDKLSGWGMSYELGYQFTPRWEAGVFASFHTNHKYVGRQLRISVLPSQSEFFVISKHFTATPRIPHTSTALKGKPLEYAGELYSEEHGRKFTTEKAGFQVVKDPTDGTRLVLAIDRKPIAEWFKEQFEKLKQNIRRPIQPQRKSRGMKL